MYAGFVLCIAACLIWAFFNQTVQKVILSIAALMFLTWIYNFLKKPSEYNRQGKTQVLIYAVLAAVCISGFFVPVLTTLFLLYMLIAFIHSFYNVITSRRQPKAIVGLVYLVISLAAIGLWYYVNEPVEPIVASTSIQDSKETKANYDNTSTSPTSNTPPIDTSSTLNYSSNSTNDNYISEPVFEKVSVKNGNMPECSFTSRYNKQLYKSFPYL